MAKKNKKGLLTEFKEFITRGSVIDMATGVIVAGAFSKIVTSLTNDILMPFVNWIVFVITGGKKGLLITILNNEPYFLEDGTTVNSACIYINWGNLITAIIDFIIIAFVIFMIIKSINAIRNRIEETKKKINEDCIKEAEKAKKEEEEKALEEAKKAAALKELALKEKAENESTNQLLVEIIDLLKK